LYIKGKRGNNLPEHAGTYNIIMFRLAAKSLKSFIYGWFQ